MSSHIRQHRTMTKHSGNFSSISRLTPVKTNVFQIFQASSQLEITYLTNFGRVSNLKALLQSGNFPPSLEPSIRKIRALYEPIPFVRQAQVQTCQTPLENDWFLHLVTRLNELFPIENHKWAASDDWHRSKSQNELAPVNSCVWVVSNFKKGEEIYTSMKTNKNNCVVALKPDAKLKYRMIDRIFLHSRTPPGLLLQTNTWLALKPLHPVPATNNPFAQLDKYAFDVTLRTLQDDPIYIVHSDELLAHCAWLKYRPRELHPKITSETYALCEYLGSSQHLLVNQLCITLKKAETLNIKKFRYVDDMEYYPAEFFSVYR
ncbi:hypothetical protein MJO28_016917 [Puccinia striiformis f. sp. tritici]|nr:hypothetical protein MJO28_016917 [Puccinia striiformis f. sp. tritici]